MDFLKVELGALAPLPPASDAYAQYIDSKGFNYEQGKIQLHEISIQVSTGCTCLFQLHHNQLLVCTSDRNTLI